MVGFHPICGSTNARFGAICNGFTALLLICFIYDGKNLSFNRFMGPAPSVFVGSRDRINGLQVTQRRITEQVGGNMWNGRGNPDWLNLQENGKMTLVEPKLCSGFYDYNSPVARCSYLIQNPDCTLGGFLNYTKFFYCDCANYAFLGYFLLAAWLVALLYLLGNTAADYFCCSLERLSDVLNLSPTVAGVSLLPLGNGAPDVFAGIAAFVGTGSGAVGLNSLLGGAVFVVCVVVGVVSLSVSSKKVRIDGKCFIRDLCFFLFSMVCLVVIMVIGEVSIGGAVAFLSIYVVYGFFVALNELWPWKLGHDNCKFHGISSLLPVAGGSSVAVDRDEGNESVCVPLLNGDTNDDTTNVLPKLPHWIWASNVAIFSDHVKSSSGTEDADPSSCGCCADGEKCQDASRFSWSNLCWLMEIPLSVPRRLTIPIVEEERWSKGYAVASAALAPVVLSFLWCTRVNLGAMSRRIGLLIGASVGLVLGLLAFTYTKPAHPPRRLLLGWVLGGFLMSIVWFYIIANELVAVLVSLGVILGINPSLLAITVLAWGNSMGDLVSNTALATNKWNGVQIAMSGCYACPMFNMVVGLGISMVLGAWSGRPKPYVIPQDSSLYYTMGFLTLGLLWALIVLPRSDMRPNRVLGIGLIVIYMMFLCFRVGTATGLITLRGHWW